MRGWKVLWGVLFVGGLLSWGVVGYAMLRDHGMLGEMEDPGMGGLIQYAFLLPAAVLHLGSFLPAGVLAARGGPRWPLVVTAAAALAVVSHWVGVAPVVLPGPVG